VDALLIAEGFRPGNFKPSFETIASIHEVMLAAGITPPPPTQPKGINNTDYTSPEQKKGRRRAVEKGQSVEYLFRVEH
jgi:hypothetical protein